MAATLVDAGQAAGEFLRFQLRIGYLDRKELVDCVADCLDDELGDAAAAEPLAIQLVDAALAARRMAEQEWRTPTGHDQLVAALGELDEAGIVSREDFGATIRDAERSVPEEARRVAAGGGQVRGTCTFNRQDAEGACDGGLLYVSYEAFPDPDPAVRFRIGREICNALTDQGLEVVWSGELRHRIGVRVEDWRVRLFTGDPGRRSLRGHR